MALQAGSEFEPRRFGPVTITDIVRFAGASGDFTPTHHDERYARAAGFPTVFAMGMYPASVLATYASEQLGSHRVRRLKVRFREKVWPGDVLECLGRVTTVEAGSGGSLRVVVELQCRTGSGMVIDGVGEYQTPGM